MRQCKQCGKTKRDHGFELLGNGNRMTICKQCHKENNIRDYNLCHMCGKEPSIEGLTTGKICAERSRKNGIAFRERSQLRAFEYKGSKCQKCGFESDILDLYDYHHVSGEKFERVSQLLGKGWSHVQEELDKCLLLCACCHRDEHYTDSYSEKKIYAFNYKGAECRMCGRNDLPIYSYDYHHRDPASKKYDISYLVAYKVKNETLEKELDKCDLLCVFCHRILHSTKKRYTLNYSTWIKWTEEEIDTLRKILNRKRSNKNMEIVLSKNLPKRSMTAINQKIGALKLRKHLAAT